MSYYYEDTPHYCYTVPAHYEDNSHYSYSVPTHYSDPTPNPVYYDSPSEPVYYDDTPADSSYYVDSPSEPIYYDDTSTDPSYYVDSPLDPNHYDNPPSDSFYYEDTTSYRIEEEYIPDTHIEATVNATPTWDSIRPAYYGLPATSSRITLQSPTSCTTVDKSPQDDAVIDTEPFILYPYPSPHWFHYGDDSYRKPELWDINSITCYDNFSDNELVKEVERIVAVLKELTNWDIEDEKDDVLPPHWQTYRNSPRFKKLAHEAQRIETVQRQRAKCGTEDAIDGEVMENQVNSLIPFLPSHHTFSDVVVTIPPPDILAPPPLPLSPNIRYILNRLRFYLHRNRKPFNTCFPDPHLHPPDILPPLPLPLKPNIDGTYSFRCSRANITWRGVDVC